MRDNRPAITRAAEGESMITIEYNWNCPNCGREMLSLLEPDELVCRWCEEGVPGPQKTTSLVDLIQYLVAQSGGRVAAELQGGLDAGAFDCLVEHPADEPPDDHRLVLAQDDQRNIFTGRYSAEWFIHSIIGFSAASYLNIKIVSWRELPAMPKETE